MKQPFTLPGQLGRLARLLLCCVAVSLLLPAGPGNASSDGAFDENQVKAVFLLHITKFVTWPTTLNEDDGTNFTIAILGEDPLTEYLDSVVAGESAGGRPIKVTRLDGHQQLTQGAVDLLFIGSEDTDIQSVIGTAHRQGILTVGHQRGFCEAGGIVNLLAENKRIRIEVNIEEAVRHDFAISAQVLRLARLVTTNKGELP